MRVKHRFVLNASEETRDITDFLARSGIPFIRSKIAPFIILEAHENAPMWPTIREVMGEVMKKHGVSSDTTTEYTETETLQAEWLRVRSKFRSEYPQPDDDFGYMRTTYNSTHFCPECGCGLVQEREFSIRRTPSWGKRHFTSLHWIEDELFCTEQAAAAVVGLEPKGVLVRPVLHHRTANPLDNVKQIQVLRVNRPGWIIDDNDYKEKIHCGTCGLTKHILSGQTQLRFKAAVFDNSFDIAKSAERFGVGWFCISLIFVSQKLFRTIRENALGKDLVFEPIVLC